MMLCFTHNINRYVIRVRRSPEKCADESLEPTWCRHLVDNRLATKERVGADGASLGCLVTGVAGGEGDE